MRVARAIASAITLVGLTVGVFLALLAYGRLPNWHELAGHPTQPLTDSTAFALLTLLAWAAWAIFTVTVAIEIAVEITGRASWRLPVRTPFEATARRLVAAITMGVTLSGPLLTRTGPGPNIAAAAAATEQVQVTPSAFTATKAAPSSSW